MASETILRHSALAYSKLAKLWNRARAQATDCVQVYRDKSPSQVSNLAANQTKHSTASPSSSPIGCRSPGIEHSSRTRNFDCEIPSPETDSNAIASLQPNLLGCNEILSFQDLIEAIDNQIEEMNNDNIQVAVPESNAGPAFSGLSLILNPVIPLFSRYAVNQLYAPTPIRAQEPLNMSALSFSFSTSRSVRSIKHGQDKENSCNSYYSRNENDLKGDWLSCTPTKSSKQIRVLRKATINL